jgi:hypothetical protein
MSREESGAGRDLVSVEQQVMSRIGRWMDKMCPNSAERLRSASVTAWNLPLCNKPRQCLFETLHVQVAVSAQTTSETQYRE